MWTAIGTVLIFLLKWWAEASAKSKLSNEQFVKFIEQHQKLRQNAGTSAQAFEDALKETLDKTKTP